MASRYLVKEVNSPKDVVVPANLKKKLERNTNLLAKKKAAITEAKNLRKVQRAALKKRATKYEKEYKVAAKNEILHRRQAKSTGNFYIESEPKMMAVIRITGINTLAPKPRKILKLLRLDQLHKTVFVKCTKPMLNMLKYIQPYIACGYPNLKTVKTLLLKRGYGRVDGQRIALQDNQYIEKCLGKYGIHGMDDLIHEIYTVGPNFKQANNFLWAFKLQSPRGGFVLKKHGFNEPKGGDWGNREELINDLIRRMMCGSLAGVFGNVDDEKMEVEVEKFGDEKKEGQKKVIVENHSEEVKKDPFEMTKKKSCTVQNPFEAATKKKCKCCQHVTSTVGASGAPVFKNTSSSNALAQGFDPLGMKQSSADIRRGMQWGSIAKIKANRKKGATKGKEVVNEELKDDDVDMEDDDTSCSISSSEEDRKNSISSEDRDGDLKKENISQNDFIGSISQNDFINGQEGQPNNNGQGEERGESPKKKRISSITMRQNMTWDSFRMIKRSKKGVSMVEEK